MFKSTLGGAGVSITDGAITATTGVRGKGVASTVVVRGAPTSRLGSKEVVLIAAASYGTNSLVEIDMHQQRLGILVCWAAVHPHALNSGMLSRTIHVLFYP
jgi:hypothetical protein